MDGRSRVTVCVALTLGVGCATNTAYEPAPLNAPAAHSAVAPASNARLRPRGIGLSGTGGTVPASGPVSATGYGYGSGGAAAPSAADDGDRWGKGLMGRPDDTGFDSIGTISAVVTAALLLPLTFSDSQDTREATGDALQILLPVFAFSGTLVEGDREGSWMMAKSFFTSWALTYVMKYSIEKWRPSGANQQSFPSGHTMGAFAGASFIQQRYGSRFGIPAYMAAVFTGISRVDSENHFMDDVVAGASIAMLSTWYWTTPISDTARVDPVVTETGGVGLGLSISNETESTIRDRHHQPEDDFQKRWRFAWAFGAAYQDQNTVQAPRDIGTVIDVASFNDIAETITTSQLTLEYYPHDQHEFDFRYAPFEVRDTGTLDAPADLNGTTINAGPVASAYRYYDARLWYRYEFLPESRWSSKLGIALAVMDIALTLTDGTNTSTADDTVIVPAIHGHLGYRFTPRFQVYAETDLASFQGDDVIDGNFMARYDLNHQWDVGLGYRFVHRQIDVEELAHKLEQHRLLLAVGHSF